MRRAIINAILFTVLAVIVVLSICYFVRCYRRCRRRRRRGVLPSHGGQGRPVPGDRVQRLRRRRGGGAAQVPRRRGAHGGRDPGGARGGGGQVGAQHAVPRRAQCRPGRGAAPLPPAGLLRERRGGGGRRAGSRGSAAPESGADPRALRRPERGEAARAPVLRRRLAPAVLARGNQRFPEMGDNLQAIHRHREGTGPPPHAIAEANHPRQPQDKQHHAGRRFPAQGSRLWPPPPAEPRRGAGHAGDVGRARVQGPRADQDAGGHAGERRLQPGSDPAGDARAEGCRDAAERPRHPPPGLVQGPGPREEDIGRVRVRPGEAEQELREGGEPQRVLRAGDGVLQPFAVVETGHEADSQEAGRDIKMSCRNTTLAN